MSEQRESSATRSLNELIRRKEKERICIENVKIAKGILNRKGSINTKSMEQMYIDHLKKKNLLQRVKVKNQRSISLAPIGNKEGCIKMNWSKDLFKNTADRTNELKKITIRNHLSQRVMKSKSMASKVQNIN